MKVLHLEQHLRAIELSVILLEQTDHSNGIEEFHAWYELGEEIDVFIVLEGAVELENEIVVH